MFVADVAARLLSGTGCSSLLPSRVRVASAAAAARGAARAYCSATTAPPPPLPAAAASRTDGVRLVEVGPRDGLQAERHGAFSVEDRAELIVRLAQRARVRTIEAGSFVSRQRVPQMADTDAVLAQAREHVAPGVSLPVLVPTVRNLERAIAAGCRDISVFVSATEGFSKANLGCSVAESLQRVEQVMAELRRREGAEDAADYRVRGYVSCVFACPYNGATKPEDVRAVSQALLDLGCYEVSLGDTIGVGTPGSVQRLLDALLERQPSERFAVHFHDTYGMALANIVAAVQPPYSIRVVDSAVGGLGGCPFAPGASGNVATEDVVYMLHGMGMLADDVDLEAAVEIGEWANRKLGREGTRSRVGQALHRHAAAPSASTRASERASQRAAE